MKDTLNIKKLAFLITISTMLPACSNSTPTIATESLLGNWSVVSIQEKTVISNSAVRLLFDGENKLSGSASCNKISSSYSSQDSALIINPVASTRKMCLSTLMDQETRFLRALNKVKHFQINNGQLSMYDQQGTLQIQAKRKSKKKPLGNSQK